MLPQYKLYFIMYDTISDKNNYFYFSNKIVLVNHQRKLLLNMLYI